jgi:hypothetical protein
MSSAADEAWRRRTWHPDTRDFNGASRLSQVITPSQFPPDTVNLGSGPPPSQPSQQLRLPGIESFDEIAPLTPPQRVPSPMMVDSDVAAHPPNYFRGGEAGPDDRRGVASQWDANLHRGLTRLDINTTPPRDSAGSWANEANQALLARAEQARVRFEPEVKTLPVPPVAAPHHPMAQMSVQQAPQAGALPPRHHQHTVSAPSFGPAAREGKRHGWYNGPPPSAGGQHPVGETIHEGARPRVDRMVHPNISSFQGFPAREQPQPPQQQPQLPPQQQPQQPQQQPLTNHQHQAVPGGMERMERIPERPPPDQQAGNRESMKRLEALVAVATSEGSAAAAY